MVIDYSFCHFRHYRNCKDGDDCCEGFERPNYNISMVQRFNLSFGEKKKTSPNYRSFKSHSNFFFFFFFFFIFFILKKINIFFFLKKKFFFFFFFFLFFLKFFFFFFFSSNFIRYFFNISTLLLNKYLYQYLGFVFPLSLTCIHMAFCSMG